MDIWISILKEYNTNNLLLKGNNILSNDTSDVTTGNLSLNDISSNEIHNISSNNISSNNTSNNISLKEIYNISSNNTSNVTTGNLSLKKACSLAKKWLPPIIEDDKNAVINILTGTEITFGIPLLRKYIEMLQPYTKILGISGKNNKPREADCVASGIVFFYGCLFYIMHFPGWGNHIEDIFLYNLLYILVDHYIDDIKVDPNTKNIAISQMFILIKDPLAYTDMSLIDPILRTIAIVYHRLIIRCPSTKDSIIKLFNVEIEGLFIQKNNYFSREIYYDIALRKGGYTMQLLQNIVGNQDPTIAEASFKLGGIMQLIDDLIDTLYDKENGINTIATYDLEHKGNLDDLWIDIMNRIDAIDSRFIIFKILYTIFAVYIPDRSLQNYTEELRKLTNPLNLFDFNGSTLLVETIMSELTAMEILDEVDK